jgi:hypothetical protein
MRQQLAKQTIELAAVAGDIGQIEDRTKDALYFADVLADAGEGACLLLEIRCGGQMIRMRVRLQNPRNLESGNLCGSQHLVGCSGAGSTRAVIVIENRIDDRCLPGDGVGH